MQKGKMKMIAKFRGKRIDSKGNVAQEIGPDNEVRNVPFIFGDKFEMQGKIYIVTDLATLEDVDGEWMLADFIEVHPDSVGMWTGPPENDMVFYDGDIIEYILAFSTSQTHTGDNIPGGSYTEPDEPFVYQVRGQIYYDECRAMWACTVITKEWGAGQRPQWIDLDSDYISIISREEYSLEYIKSLCCEKCESCESDECWILQQTKSKNWDELERKMNAIWVIGNIHQHPDPLAAENQESDGEG